MQYAVHRAATSRDKSSREHRLNQVESSVASTNSSAATALLLQGPIGPFFARFGKELERRGFNVLKINFNGGDRLFYPLRNSVDYSGDLNAWGLYLEQFITNKSVDRIYLFGDCRAYHQIARVVAERLNVRVFVFEEGYLRPNFITLEEWGVNGHSKMMNADLELADVSVQSTSAAKIRCSFCVCAILSMIYYWASAWHRTRFSHYEHHRPFEWFSEGRVWVRSLYRKIRYQGRSRKQLTECLARYDKNYFVCPLQVHCDTQVRVHSAFNSIEQFIGEVLSSFAHHAPTHSAIVFKHHPLDRGYTDYTTLIDRLQAELGLHGRVFYVHDVFLPALLQRAAGAVMINSTVGLQSLFHDTPVKVMGEAIYDRKGLTFQGTLEQFWREPGEIDTHLYARFRHYLINTNQLCGNFYVRLGDEDAAGLQWSAHMRQEHYPETHLSAHRAQARVKLRLVSSHDMSDKAAAGSGEDQSRAA